MSKENGFFCENPEHGHITEAEAIECYGRGLLLEINTWVHSNCSLSWRMNKIRNILHKLFERERQ